MGPPLVFSTPFFCCTMKPDQFELEGDKKQLELSGFQINGIMRILMGIHCMYSCHS